VRRRRQLGALAYLDAGAETLDEYVMSAWGPGHLVHLAPKTRKHYAATYELHIAPYIGALPLRDITPDVVRQWQVERLKTGAGKVAVRHALELLGSILQQAFEAQRITLNPVRLVRKARRPKRKEKRPLSPANVEDMRRCLLEGGSQSPLRDATPISVLAYSGLRPGEALALRWGDVGRSTLLVERAVSLGEEKGTKTEESRSVRLLSPLVDDLERWREECGHAGEGMLMFPGHDGQAWSDGAYQSWRRRAFNRARQAAGVDTATPYTLRHSFASLLLHEGRSVVYVARQLGHDAQLTLSHYGHVI
jgi:integrase